MYNYSIEGIPVPIYQDKGELWGLRERVRELKPRKILEIGSLFGGTLWCWMQDAPKSQIVSVDCLVFSYDHRHEEVVESRNLWHDWAVHSGCDLVPVIGDSTKAETIDLIKRYAPFDFVFIDGGHDYNTALTDFHNYWPLVEIGGMLAFHDIAYPDGNSSGYDVAKVWREVRTGNSIEIIRENNPEGIWGIGCMWKEAV